MQAQSAGTLARSG